MKYQINKVPLLIMGLLLVLFVLLPLGVTCELGARLKVENQTDQTLSIFVRFGEIDASYHIGDVAPGAKIKNKNPKILISDVYYIEAKNLQGKVVYSRKFWWEELETIKWKVVIPPLQK